MKLVQRASRKKLVQGMETFKLAAEEKMTEKKRAAISRQLYQAAAEMHWIACLQIPVIVASGP